MFELLGARTNMIRYGVHPMQFMLSIYELPFADGWSGAYNPNDPYPKTFTIDYFRAYRPDRGYDF